MICPNCNAEISDNLTFCENCGVRLAPDRAPVAEHGVPAAVVAPLEQSMAASDGAGDANGAPDPGSPAQQAASEPVTPKPAASAGNQGNGAPESELPPSSPYAQASSPTYTTPVPQDDKVSTTPFVLAIVALVTAILGLFPVSIVLAIIALVMNSGQKKRGEFSTKQSPTTVMSVISLVISALMLVLSIVVGSALLAALATGSFSTTGKVGSVTMSVPNSQSSGASSPSASAASASAFAGAWEIESMTYEGESYTTQDLSFLRDMGMDVKLVLASDGKAKLTIFGVSQDGTWRETGPESAEVTLLGVVQKATMSTGALVLENGTDKLTFLPAAS